MIMKVIKITSGGQISIPAAIRKRWSTETLSLEDRGDSIVLRPAPDDPIAAFKGIWSDLNLPPTEEMRRQAREDERRAEERKWGRS
jgi:AbrB family looped-hinge helix DNA binding protein